MKVEIRKVKTEEDEGAVISAVDVTDTIRRAVDLLRDSGETTGTDLVVFTNILDMFQWDRGLREGKVLTPEEQKIMYTPVKLGNGEEAVFDVKANLGYGFGWAIGRDEELGRIVSHSGGMPVSALGLSAFLTRTRYLSI